MFKQFGKSYFKPAALFVFLFLSVLWLGQTDAFAATYTVTNANDSGVGSLRWALTQAGTDANGSIVFDTALAGRTIPLQSDLTLWNNVTQTGTTMGSASGNFSLTGLTDASGAPAITIDGGGNRGIWASGTGTFSISNVKFKNFQYTDNSGGHDNYGSVITLWGNAYSTVNLTNVVFDSNIGVYGLRGGIVSLMANTPSSAINVDRCVFSNNSIIADLNASNPHIVTQLSTYCTGNVLVCNSLFRDNSSLAKAGTSYGSAMCLGGSANAYVYNNTFVNNAVTNSGVGARGSVVYFETSLLYLYNNIMFGNTANGSVDNYYGSGSMSSGSNLTPADLSLFVDAANKNFRLASGASAAIGKGDDTRSTGTYDLAGAPRKNSTVDIGAYEYYPAPLVTQVSPGGGPVTGGTSLSILGSNFDNVTSVMFGGNAAAFSRQNSGQILATAPAGSLGSVNVKITTAGGTSAATIYSTYDYLPPTISSATYDANTGTLTVTGANLCAGSSISVNKLTLTGEGGSSYILTTPNLSTTSNTTFSVTLNAADKAAVNQILNKNGSSSTSGTTFNLAAADDWDSAVTDGNTADATNTLTVNNVAVPTISSAAYNAADGTTYNLAAAEDWARGADTAVLVADLNGNGITASNTNSLPVITLTTPNKNLLYNGTQTITVSGTVSDADKQTVTVSATIDGKTRSASIDTNTDSSWTLTWSISSLSISDGIYTGISFDADDGSGGTASATYNGNITVDTQAPDTTIATCPPNPCGSTSANFTLSSDDVNANFEASLDGAAFSPSTSPISFTGLAEGYHTFSVRAVDAAGNTDPTPASYTWTVDYTGPTVSISTPSAIATAGGSITYIITYTGADTITLAAGDITLNTTGTASGSVSVSGAGVTTRTVTISGISGDGTLGISIAAGTASDSIGNVALASGLSSTFTADNTAPTGTLSINNGAAYTTDPQVTLSITSSDGAGSGVYQMRFSVDAASWSPWQNISDTKTGTLPTQYGTVTLYMQLRDNVGNISNNISDTIFYKASPISSNVTKYGTENNNISFSSSDFKYSSSDGSTLKEIKVETLPVHGKLMLDNTEISVSQKINSTDLDRIVFVPATSWNGSDGFTWKGYDGTLWTDTTEISLFVTHVNHPPVAINSSITIYADTQGSGTLSATDADGDALTFAVATQGTKGTLVITDPWKGTFVYTPVIGEFGEDSVTFSVYDQQTYTTPGALTIHIVPASDADLSALSISSGTLSPAFSANTIDYKATVASSVNSITVTASAKGSHSTIKINGIPITSGSTSSAINLSVGINNITVEVIAQDGTKKTYTLKITRETSSSADDSSSSGRSSNIVINTPDDGVNIQFNGEAMKAGTLNTHTDSAGQTVATVTVDQQKLEKKLAEARSNCVITIFVPDKPDVAVAELNGQMLSSLKSKQSTLEIKTSSAAYALPAAQINIDAISAQLGSPVQLSDIKVSVKISSAPHETAKVLENIVKSGKFSIVAPPVDFTVECTYGGRNVFISTFNAYVERMLAIPDGVDPSSITTGIVIDTDGTVRHVPTKIVTINGKYFAKINSLTNSSYAVIRHPLQFGDTEKHWSKDAVNDMGSRMIITGTGEGMFEPDRDITRAEFAAIMVRALGLKPGTGSNPFTDVKDGMWYSDYIRTTYQYNIISGYSDNTFRPTDKITREQAMAMIAKAMKLTGLKTQYGDDAETQNILSTFTDLEEVSAWAKDGMAACVRTGIISGRSNGLAAPKANVTRAEVAVMIKKLLQKSNLI